MHPQLDAGPDAPRDLVVTRARRARLSGRPGGKSSVRMVVILRAPCSIVPETMSRDGAARRTTGAGGAAVACGLL